MLDDLLMALNPAREEEKKEVEPQNEGQDAEKAKVQEENVEERKEEPKEEKKGKDLTDIYGDEFKRYYGIK